MGEGKSQNPNQPSHESYHVQHRPQRQGGSLPVPPEMTNRIADQYAQYIAPILAPNYLLPAIQQVMSGSNQPSVGTQQPTTAPTPNKSVSNGMIVVDEAQSECEVYFLEDDKEKDEDILLMVPPKPSPQ